MKNQEIDKKWEEILNTFWKNYTNFIQRKHPKMTEQDEIALQTVISGNITSFVLSLNEENCEKLIALHYPVLRCLKHLHSFDDDFLSQVIDYELETIRLFKPEILPQILKTVIEFKNETKSKNDNQKH